jgi:o-succinylbenzoate synthase
MQIEAVELFHLRLPTTDTVLVRLESGGMSGWGEACLPQEPVDSPEWSGGVVACLRDFLGPAARGQSFVTGDLLQTSLQRFRGNPIAKSAIDCAWWDLEARTHATTVAALLGGTREKIETSLTFGVMSTIDELLEAINQHPSRTEETLLILKFRPGWDVQTVRAVRQVFPAVPIAVDCEASFQLGDREILYRLDDFMLRWIEQPFAADDLVGHAMLQETIRTPICLHESICSLSRVEQAIDLNSCRAIRIDPNLVGGLTPSRAIYESCQGSEIALAAGIRAATSIGIDRIHSLASLPDFSLPTELIQPSTLESTIFEKGDLVDRQYLLDIAIAHAVL